MNKFGDLHGKKVLVTGGAGFIGSHLCEALAENGAILTVVDNLENGRVSNLSSIEDTITFLQIDIRDEGFNELFLHDHFEYIFHMAANAYVPPSVKDPAFDFNSNLVLTFKILELLRKRKSVSKLIVISSAAVYGDPQTLPIYEDHIVAPISPYGVSKLAIEQYAKVYSLLYGLKTASARLFSVYGPRQRKQIVFDFIQKLTDNPSEMVILGNGEQTRDLVYVKDVVKALLIIATSSPLRGDIYNVATGNDFSTLQIAKVVASSMSVQPRFTFTGNVRPGDPDKWRAGIEKIRSLGFEAETSLESGIQETVDWFRSE